MPHPQDFEFNGDSLDKMNSRSLSTMLFAHLERQDDKGCLWIIKIGSLPIYVATETYGLTSKFSLTPFDADDAYCVDLLYANPSINSIDDVMNYLQKRMNI